jgi:energy-coupling factor transport system permease protein
MKFDARIKILTIAVLTGFAVFADIYYLAGTLAVALIFDIVYRVNFGAVLRRVWYLLPAVLAVALLQSLTIGGTAGLLAGAAFFLRMSVIIASSIIASTSDTREMTDALIKMKFPYELAFAVSAALRFLPMLRGEFVNRVNAMRLRGINIKKLGIGKKIKAYAYVLSPAVVGCAMKSRALAAAMSARAFRAYEARTMLREMRLNLYDFGVIIALAAYSVAFILLRIFI